MPLTDQQEKAVKSANEPLFIQAGAGTGKTFTLTNRIAYGLSSKSGPLVQGVDRLLTITFTNKAAAELIGRIRAELRAQGLTEASLLIDGAWISTIHAMCNRMLLAHAFEVGVDPGANMLTDDESKALAAQAMESLLQDLAGDARLQMLLSCNDSDKAIRLIKKLSEVLALAPGGKDDFQFGPTPPVVRTRQIHDLILLLGDVKARIEGEPFPDDDEKYPKACMRLEKIIEWLEALLDNGDIEAWTEVAVGASKLELPTGRFKKDFAETLNPALEAIRGFVDSLLVASAYEQLQCACGLALEHLRRYADLKRGIGALDTDDLLIGAYHLLAQRPDVAHEYEEKFQSIMVDEFQDTDSLQVGIIKLISNDELSALATVGDAQQSIYGFRGADLEIYQEMRAAMAQRNSLEVELTDNFRSHSHILSFVEQIFAKPEFFGDGFLKVKSGYAVDAVPDWLEEDEPRIKMLMTAGTKKKEGRSVATPVEKLRIADARALADEFEKLHNERHARYGDMAILVRSTKDTYVGAYLHELRSRGIPCVIAGGSDFFEKPEVVIVSKLLSAIADCDDDEALYDLLGSSFFDASDDDLLELRVMRDQLKLQADDARSKVSLYDALEQYAKRVQEAGAGSASQSLVQAAHTLQEAMTSAQSMPMAQVIRNAVRSSGWERTLAQRGVEGGAVFANVERACDWVEDYEQLYGRSIFGVSEYFRNLVDPIDKEAAVKAKPGTLVSSGKDAVQIMTIHSSKGLEFPIVAVAEFESGSSGDKDGVISLSQDSKRYLALKSTTMSPKDDVVESFDQAADASDYASYASHLAKQRAYEESQRLLYVALTRARDMLILVVHDGAYLTNGTLAKGLAKDMLEAIYDGEVPHDNDTRHVPTGALVELSITKVAYEDELSQRESADLLEVPHSFIQVQPAPAISSQVRASRDIHSYSSLAHRDEAPVELVPQAITLRDRSNDIQTVSPVGSAFHLVAQWLATVKYAQRDDLEGRLRAAARRYRLDDQELDRLVAAVEAWVSSDLHARTQAFDRRFAEYPFCIDVQGVALEGFIDLACFDSSGNALIVDYKTGTSGQGEDLHDRYEFQATCYAYALLSTGACSHVDVVFVRPEAGMEQVAFSFSKDDPPRIERFV